MKAKECCRLCKAWDIDGATMSAPKEVEILRGTDKGKKRRIIVPLHHCKRHCPQIIWHFTAADVATTWPATSGNETCCDFIPRDTK